MVALLDEVRLIAVGPALSPWSLNQALEFDLDALLTIDRVSAVSCDEYLHVAEHVLPFGALKYGNQT